MNMTAQRLMDLAEAHIRDLGYGGFSFRDLAAEIGIKSASVHHHFPTKATMAAAVAKRYGERFFASVALRPNESAEDAISTYRSAFRAALAQDGRMCLCGVSDSRNRQESDARNQHERRKNDKKTSPRPGPNPPPYQNGAPASCSLGETGSAA